MVSVAHHTIQTVWQIEAPRLIGGLLRMVSDVAIAEDLAQDALVAALEHWPQAGIPDNPGAWLMTTAKHRAIDFMRHQRMTSAKHQSLAQSAQAELGSSAESPAGDDILRLMLASCHPILAQDSRVALTLRLLGGLSTDEIARAFMVPESTIAQRIVRAKRSLTAARVPFDIPTGSALAERVPAVLEVIYLIFNEGYAATAGDDWMRPQLCRDAMRLGRVLTALIPREAEAHGLLALMELQASRMRARVDQHGAPILLLDQNRTHWDHDLIRHGLKALATAEGLAQPLGGYALQAAIAACHARAHTAAQTDWHLIVALYDALLEVTHSPVVALNRAMATAMAHGPAEALPLLDELRDAQVLVGYPYLPAARGDLLSKLNRLPEAQAAFEQAAHLTQNARERAQLLSRAAALRSAQNAGLMANPDHRT